MHAQPCAGAASSALYLHTCAAVCHAPPLAQPWSAQHTKLDQSFQGRESQGERDLEGYRDVERLALVDRHHHGVVVQGVDSRPLLNLLWHKGAGSAELTGHHPKAPSGQLHVTRRPGGWGHIAKGVSIHETSPARLNTN